MLMDDIVLLKYLKRYFFCCNRYKTFIEKSHKKLKYNYKL